MDYEKKGKEEGNYAQERGISRRKFLIGSAATALVAGATSPFLIPGKASAGFLEDILSSAGLPVEYDKTLAIPDPTITHIIEHGRLPDNFELYRETISKDPFIQFLTEIRELPKEGFRYYMSTTADATGKKPNAIVFQPENFSTQFNPREDFVEVSREEGLSYFPSMINGTKGNRFSQKNFVQRLGYYDEEGREVVYAIGIQTSGEDNGKTLGYRNAMILNKSKFSLYSSTSDGDGGGGGIGAGPSGEAGGGPTGDATGGGGQAGGDGAK